MKYKKTCISVFNLAYYNKKKNSPLIKTIRTIQLVNMFIQPSSSSSSSLQYENMCAIRYIYTCMAIYFDMENKNIRAYLLY